MKAAIGSRAFIPMRLLSRKEVRRAQTALKYTEVVAQRVEAILSEMQEDEYEEDSNYTGPKKVTVNEYLERRDGVSIPRDYAVKNFPEIQFKDNTVFPKHKVKLGKGPTPRDDNQLKFFNDLLLASKNGIQCVDILANADTGTGKSVAGIWLGHQLKTRTLIIVDSNKIAESWLKNFRKFYGKEWTKKYVGRVQQDLCEYEGKAFSIGLVQSIARRKYPHEFYKAWGLVAFDEVQIFGAPHYAGVLGKFPARVRVGFTAENRKGSFGRRIKAHLGDTQVVSRQKVLQPTAYLIRNTLKQTFYCKSDGAILTGLSRVEDRNAKLAKLIYNRGWKRGRNVLILSDRTEQLVNLRNRCLKLGIPAKDMGLHMGRYESGEYEVVYSYSPSGSKRSLAVFPTFREAKSVVTSLNKGLPSLELPRSLKDRLRKDRSSVYFGHRKRVYAPDQNELDNITNFCQLVFATYQIFSKGVDVPRLDMGVEGLPSGNLKQPLGRILRLHDDKPAPEWYAVCDRVKLEGSFGNAQDSAATLLNTFLSGKTNTRIKALQRANAKIVKA